VFKEMAAAHAQRGYGVRKNSEKGRVYRIEQWSITGHPTQKEELKRKKRITRAKLVASGEISILMWLGEGRDEFASEKEMAPGDGRKVLKTKSSR